MGKLIFAAYLSLFATNVAYSQDSLPEGEGRNIVEYVCSQCHGLLQVTTASKTAEQWQHLVTQMKNQGAPIEEYEINTIVRYLSEHFGE